MAPPEPPPATPRSDDATDDRRAFGDETASALAAALPPSPLARLLTPLGGGHALRTTLAALAAWGTTVAPAAFARSSPIAPRALAALALIAALAGPRLAPRRLARHVGISAFLALSLATWLLSSAAIAPSRLDPVRSALGALAWGVFALSWSDPWQRAPKPPFDPNAPELEARSQLAPLAVPVATIGVLGAFACLTFAWFVVDPDRALFAQAVALGCAVALITVSATVATGRGRRRSSASARLSAVALRSLLLLVAFSVAGAILLSFR